MLISRPDLHAFEHMHRLKKKLKCHPSDAVTRCLLRTNHCDIEPAPGEGPTYFVMHVQASPHPLACLMHARRFIRRY